MTKYKIVMHYSNGESEEDDDIFEDEESAEEYGNYLVGCSSLGAEILNLSNPGDYPLEEADEADFDIIEVEDNQ